MPLKRSPVGEPHHGVVMQGVRAVGQHGVEAAPLDGERVPIQPEDVVRVDGADGGFEARVEGG